MSQCISDSEQRHDLIVGLIPCEIKIVLIHIVELQCIQFVDKSL